MDNLGRRLIPQSSAINEWTEDDELLYRSLFGDSLMVLPDEVEQDDEE
ncbi:hypothetical protein ACNZ61_002793 [Enterococcus hirae]